MGRGKLSSKAKITVEDWDGQRKTLFAAAGMHAPDLTEAFDYLQGLPARRNLAVAMAQAARDNSTLVQPRGGLPFLEEHAAFLRFIQKDGLADVLPTTIDNLTRLGRWREVESHLNIDPAGLQGFPLLNHGLDRCRLLLEGLRLPVQVRHMGADPGLVAEIALAAGFTGLEGGGISSNLPYLKDKPLSESLASWRYIDRLVGRYAEEGGVPLHRETCGALTGALVPPCLSHSVAILEGLLAAEQGVTHLSLGYGQGGNLVQDVAALRCLAPLAGEYLNRLGCSEVTVTVVFYQWMGGFPQAESQAYGVLAWGAAVAGLAGAHRVITKTPTEATGSPNKEAIASGLMATRQVINMVKDQPLPEFPALKEEMAVIAAETRAILDRVWELGEGNLSAGVEKAFALGILDVPFAASRYNQGRVLPARDCQGAIRLLETGNLPLPEELLELHREKMQARGRREGRQPSYQMVLEDLYAIGKGMLVGQRR